jgi:hypothetical protein
MKSADQRKYPLKTLKKEREELQSSRKNTRRHRKKQLSRKGIQKTV